MSFRDPKFNDFPPPHYHPLNPAVTLKIHHGGQICNTPPAYVGGYGTRGKKYYRSDACFVLLFSGKQIFDLCIEHERDREVHVYLEGEIGGEVENNEDAIELNENNGDSGDSEDCLDGDYHLGREEVDAENNRIDEDDDLFNNHVDGEESEEARGGDEEGSEEDLSDNSKGFSDSDNFDSDKASENENGPKYPSFNSIDTYNPQFQLDPRRAVKGFRQDAIKDMRVHVSRNQSYRAKWKALKKIEGSSEEQYGRLRDYAEELRRSNPGSTVILNSDLDDFTGVSKFGPHGGVLLTAVDIDPNNACYPIAFAVVFVENRDAWEWFLRLLKHDLGIERESNFTFMSDKQKGLLPAFEYVLPLVENRFCVRHLHGNMKRAGFIGLAYKKALWMAARATTTADLM
ncbi:hypothetical protein Sango_2321300 [Sesamum angolense]|uniref:MULE transposase domain-containing protein n=1 Tax=Sesamum angolense TaxID=2727404 RepID=A0AAE1WAN2_9LAMI|nr:hypothetical protein Sango_2321300 [Sesamum angolense]